MHQIATDVGYATRSLGRWPAFTALTVLLLALGTGATTAMLSLVNGVLLTPPAYEDPARLVLVAPARVDGQPFRGPCTGRQCAAWIAASAFERGATYFWIFDYLVLDEGSESLEGLAVGPEYFDVIGRRPALGRPFTREERGASSHPVAIIGHDLWQRRFRGDPQVIGRSITLSRHRTLTIVGVMPPGIRFLPAPLSEASPGYDVDAMVDLWVPQALDAFPPDIPIWNVVARLRTGATVDQARAEIATIARQQASERPAWRELTAVVTPVPQALNAAPARLLWPLLGAAACVLVIACAHAGALQLGRSLRRAPELAVHSALGATPARLVRQVLLEHLLMGSFGGTAGALLAYAILTGLARYGAATIVRLDAVAIDGRVLAISVVAGLVCGAGAGLPAVWRATRGGAAAPGGQASSRATRGGGRTLQALTALQIAVTLALMAGGGLLLQSWHRLSTVSLGYETDHLLTMMVTDVRGEWQAFHRRALERVGFLPGVTGSAFAWGVPLTGTGASTAVRVPGADQAGLTVAARAVTPTFFEVFRMTIREGRAFRDTDAAGARSVAIVNATLARTYFPGTSPIGRVIEVPGWDESRREIVGVVADVRAQSVTEAAAAEVYLPLQQATAFSKHLIVRTAGDASVLAPMVEAALREVDPTVAIEATRTFAQVRADATAGQRLITAITTAFAIAGTILAAAGIYGALAWVVARRRRELAIRIALGAGPTRVVRLVLGVVSRPLLAGTATGLCLAIVTTRALRAWLFGIEAHDPVTFLVASGVLGGVALLATCFPVRQALRIDPGIVLRADH